MMKNKMTIHGISRLVMKWSLLRGPSRTYIGICLLMILSGAIQALPQHAASSNEASDIRGANVLRALLPQAFFQAKAEIARKYPSVAARMADLRRPEVKFRAGGWEVDGEWLVLGETDSSGDPAIQIGVTGEMAEDYDTAVHEYKHYIIDQLGLGEDAHDWVDEGQSGLLPPAQTQH
jgi:hypothetical protein